MQTPRSKNTSGPEKSHFHHGLLMDHFKGVLGEKRLVSLQLHSQEPP